MSEHFFESNKGFEILVNLGEDPLPSPLVPLVWLAVVLPLLTPPPPTCQHLCLSLCHCLLSHPSWASCLAGCCVASPHTAASYLLASPPFIVPSLLLLLQKLHKLWQWQRAMLSRASHRAPLRPLVQQVVALPLLSIWGCMHMWIPICIGVLGDITWCIWGTPYAYGIFKCIRGFCQYQYAYGEWNISNLCLHVGIHICIWGFWQCYKDISLTHRICCT